MCDKVSVEVRYIYTNIVRITKNDDVLFMTEDLREETVLADRSGLSTENIFNYAFADREIRDMIVWTMVK